MVAEVLVLTGYKNILMLIFGGPCDHDMINCVVLNFWSLCLLHVSNFVNI